MLFTFGKKAEFLLVMHGHNRKINTTGNYKEQSQSHLFN